MKNNIVSFNVGIYQKLQAIASPLFSATGFKHFVFIKLVGNKRLIIGTNPEWITLYTREKLYNSVIHNSNIINPLVQSSCHYNKKVVLWDENKNTVFKAANSVGMHHGLMIGDGNEIFSFSTSPEKQQLAYRWGHNIAFISEFIFRFRESAYDIIDNFPSDVLLETTNSTYQKNAHNKSTNFFDYKNTKKFFIFNHRKEKCAISFKEVIVLKEMAKGKTLKEVASNMQISSRTIEKHVANLKVKLKCNCKSQLVSIYTNSILLNI